MEHHFGGFELRQHYAGLRLDAHLALRNANILDANKDRLTDRLEAWIEYHKLSNAAKVAGHYIDALGI